jgi:hypothetical protein
MNVCKMIVVATALTLNGTGVQAQSTLGDLQDMGFKKMAQNEFASTIVGRKLSGVNFHNANDIEFEFKPNGSMSGTWDGTRAGFGQGSFSGVWRMDDGGKLCTDTRTSWGTNSQCAFFFRLGDQHYASLSESDRKAEIRKRTIMK